MPIYQYRCGSCERRVELFVRKPDAATASACPECGSRRLKRVMSSFARARSDRERLDAIDLDQELGRVDSRDQASFARWARRLGDQYDSELGSDFRELADRADAGEDPVERADVAHTLRYRVERKRSEVQAPPAEPAGEGS